MNLSQQLLRPVRPRGSAQTRSVVWIYRSDGPVRQLHRQREVALRRNLNHSNARGREPLLDSGDESGGGKVVSLRHDVPGVRMNPMVATAFERHDAAGQPQK